MSKRFLILRPEKQAQDLISELEKQKDQYFIEPIFEVENIDLNIEENDIQTAILTSFNAIYGFLSANLDKNVKIFVISEKIAQELSKNGYENVIFSQKSNSNSLKDTILSQNLSKNDKILYFCSNYISFDFSEFLNEKGFNSNKILAYKVKYFDQFSSNFLNFIQNNQFDYVLCYSQNVVESFVKLIKKHNLVEYFNKSKIMGFSSDILKEIEDNNFKEVGHFNSLKILKDFYNM